MPTDLTERLAASLADRERLAAVVRRLITAVVTTNAPAEAYLAATVLVERALDAIAAHVPDPPLPRFGTPGSMRGPADFFPFDPMVGRLSPLAPPVAVEWDGTRCIGHARFDTPYEGPPGCVHGGVIAAVLDQMLAIPNIMLGAAGPTKHLALRYRRPTPLAADLVFEGWRDRTEGKYLHCRGRVRAGDEVTVEAEATFVAVTPEQIMTFGQRRGS